MAVKVPETLAHLHYWSIQLTRSASKEEILDAFRASSRISLIRTDDGLGAINTVKELMAGLMPACMKSRSGKTCWRDVHACFSGGLAAEADALFDAFWCGHTNWEPLRHAAGDSRIVQNTTRTCRVQLRCTIKDQLAAASESIWLVTPYFVPDGGLRRQLVLAARRRLLMPNGNHCCPVRPPRVCATTGSGTISGGEWR